MIEYDITWAQLEANPFAAFSAARDVAPIGWCEPLRGFAVLSHQGCRETLQGSGRFATQKEGSKPHEVIGASMLTSDGMEHRRLRRPFDPSFRPRAVVEVLSEIIDDEVDRMMDTWRGRGRAALSRDLARLVPVAVICRILGLRVDATSMRTTYDAFAAALGDYRGDAADERARAARVVLESQLIAGIRADDSTASGLLAGVARAPETEMTLEEIVTNALIVMFGAIETVETLIVNAVYALLAHPETWHRVQDDRVLIPRVVDEVLRWAPPVGFLGRVAVGNQWIEGTEIPSGSLVCAILPAANRDPTIFADPDVFDIDRHDSAGHLAFGYGPHGCLGNSLARRVTATVLDRLVQHFAGLRWDDDEGRPRLSGFPFHRPREIHLRWDEQ